MVPDKSPSAGNIADSRYESDKGSTSQITSSPQPIIGLTTLKLHDDDDDDVNAPLGLCSVGEGPLRRADVEDVVASYESVTIFVLQLAVHVLFGLLHRNVHITVQASQNTWFRVDVNTTLSLNFE